jgi:hypothetical protein
MSLVVSYYSVLRMPDIRESRDCVITDNDVTEKHIFWACPQPKITIQCSIDDEFLTVLRMNRATYHQIEPILVVTIYSVLRIQRSSSCLAAASSSWLIASWSLL